MATVKVIFSRRHALGSLFLRGWLWSHWSHCGIMIDDQTVIEAKAFAGVVVSSREEHLKGTSSHLIIEIPVESEEQREAVIQAAMSQVGHRYDWIGLVGLGLRNRHITSETKWFCSELIAWAFEEAGHSLLRILPWRVSPHHIYIPVFR